MFLAPAVVGHLRHANRAHHLRHRVALRRQHINLARSFATISSGLGLLTIFRPPSGFQSHTSGRTTSMGEDHSLLVECRRKGQRARSVSPRRNICLRLGRCTIRSIPSNTVLGKSCRSQLPDCLSPPRISLRARIWRHEECRNCGEVLEHCV